MNTKIILLFLLAAATVQSCKDPNEPDVTETGLKYKFHTKNEGATPKAGDFITIQLAYRTETDSLLMNTATMGGAINVPLQEPTFRGSMEEAFAMMSNGDSATFWIPVDSLFEKTLKQPIPPFLKKGSVLKADCKMINFRSKEAFEKEMQAENMKMMQAEKDMIDDYLMKNNLTAQTTESGIRYVVVSDGKGAPADSGQIVKVDYTGKFLDGKVFDTSHKPGGQPYEFTLGRGEVIRGWDEGLTLMKEGGKAILIVPSEMGYGHRGVQDLIPPYSTLVFDVELVKVTSPSSVQK